MPAGGTEKTTISGADFFAVLAIIRRFAIARNSCSWLAEGSEIGRFPILAGLLPVILESVVICAGAINDHFARLLKRKNDVPG